MEMYASGYISSIPGCKSLFHPPRFTNDMVSTPAEINNSPEPILIEPAAECATCIDEPHSRLVVIPGIVFGRPGRYVAIRPRFNP